MQATLLGRVLSGYGDLRRSFRGEQARISEASLLLYAMLGCALVFAARLPALVATVPPGIDLADFAGAQFVGHVFFGPLMLYALAALVRIAARMAGGAGGWQTGRLALFWALLLAVPPMLVSQAIVTALDLGGEIARVLLLLPWLAYLWFWAVGLSEFEQLRRTPLVFVALLAVPLAFAGLLRIAATAG
ncbi:MAG: YIP1 family protein [Pseudomonadota bacterium]